MSDEQPEEQPEPAADEPAADTEAKPPPAEQPDEDSDEPDAKASASDPTQARKLHQDARAMENALAALLGERHGNGIGNVFVANTIGLVDAGLPRASGSRHGSLPTGPIPAESLSRVIGTFVKPANYDELRRRLRDQWLVLLRAPTGWGRTATALNLLGVECALGVDKLSPDTDLRSPSTPIDLSGDRGYLLEALEFDQAAALSEFSLDLWRLRLEQSKSRMVVLVAAETPLRERELAAYLVDGAQRADDQALVLSHFRTGLRAAGLPAQDLADFPEFADLVEEVVSRTLRAHDLADLGRGLCAVVSGDRTIEDVRLQYALSAESAFREWFEGLPDNEHRAFAIALGSLDGMPLATVAEAGTALAKLIQAAEIPDPHERTRAVFAIRTQDLVERMDAEITSTVEDSELGSLAAEVVRFRDPHRPRKVLEHVWREYPEAHGVVRRWLRGLGSSPDRHVRIRAGVAVGLLSLAEFDHARRHVIEPWADENDYWERQAVIGALRLPAMEPDLQPLITRMIDRWLKGKAATGRRTAAVAALATLPIMTTAQVLKRLRRAADTDEPRMIISVADAVTTLSLEDDRLDLVLGALLLWTRATRTTVRDTALMCVLQLIVYLQVSEDGSTDPWPGLLWVADLDRRADDPERRVAVGAHRLTRREAVVQLIARALEAQYFMPDAFKVVQRWVKTAQRDNTQLEPLGALLADVVGAIGSSGTVRSHLADWARARRGPVDAVTRLLAVLDREENRP
ncbi:hypothetical protein [Saccharothrix sp. NRRL B-16314]|uniref:hypothetical protein n=1 Tax=Saccharothrix sp. NRRL B-16314 TaxID=1463825 RepID=UPI000526BB88|nr:hypothetical protein [Saccharothrix sp. NRRL B-16314]